MACHASRRICALYLAINLEAARFSEPGSKTSQKVGTQKHVELKIEQHAGLPSSGGKDGQAKRVREGQNVDDGKVRHDESTDMEAMIQGGISESFPLIKIWVVLILVGLTIELAP